MTVIYNALPALVPGRLDESHSTSLILPGGLYDGHYRPLFLVDHMTRSLPALVSGMSVRSGPTVLNIQALCFNCRQRSCDLVGGQYLFSIDSAYSIVSLPGVPRGRPP